MAVTAEEDAIRGMCKENCDIARELIHIGDLPLAAFALEKVLRQIREIEMVRKAVQQ